MRLPIGFGGMNAAILEAIGKSFAIIEFDSSGNILRANANFLNVMGYARDEVVGKHHRMFVDPNEVESSAYRDFWEHLGRGEQHTGQFKRFGNGHRTVWIQAAYSPVLDRRGRVKRVVKIAADITQAKIAAAENESQMQAFSRSQAVISFTPEGVILDANENFLGAMGYEKHEIVGHHHRMFVDPVEAGSTAYAEFWGRLRRGEFIAQEFRRFGKGGTEVWIQASYNPIVDADGRITKVVKIATDLSQRMASISVLGAGLDRLAKGNLTCTIDEPLPGTMEALRHDYNIAVEKLGEVIGELSASAGEINRGCEEIAQGADNLSKRTEQQAASLEETAAALDEITATGKKAADGAEHAREVVRAAEADAQKAGEVVQRTVDAIGNIEKSSNKINQIIGVIDEIAFQTNLLALNAGVEAARAGDAGRGFAVVASEVRALAQRSAEAAREIKSLISTSTAQVAEGVGLVTETGVALRRILAQVTDINKVVVDIAAGAQEQSTGLQQVNTAVNQMDQVTQQNATMVEEATAASHALMQESEKLGRMVRQFEVAPTARDSVSGARTQPRENVIALGRRQRRP